MLTQRHEGTKQSILCVFVPSCETHSQMSIPLPHFNAVAFRGYLLPSWLAMQARTMRRHSSGLAGMGSVTG